MDSDSNVKKLTVSATTTLGSVLVTAIGINKTLVGSLSISEGATSVAIFVATTPVGTYHIVPNGARYGNFQANLSTTDDVTVFSRIA